MTTAHWWIDKGNHGQRKQLVTSGEKLQGATSQTQIAAPASGTEASPGDMSKACTWMLRVAAASKNIAPRPRALNEKDRQGLPPGEISVLLGCREHFTGFREQTHRTHWGSPPSECRRRRSGLCVSFLWLWWQRATPVVAENRTGALSYRLQVRVWNQRLMVEIKVPELAPSLFLRHAHSSFESCTAHVPWLRAPSCIFKASRQHLASVATLPSPSGSKSPSAFFSSAHLQSHWRFH